MKRSAILLYASAFIIISVILLLVYATVQQSHRSGANDPQLQMAYDIAAQLESGKEYTPGDTINLAKSLAPFVVLYNKEGQPTQSSGYLEGRFPQVPTGVLNYARTHGEDVVTWQPRSDVRMAMVIKSITSPSASFVAVGRSLQGVEQREAGLRKMVFMAWLICLVILGLSWVVSSLFVPNP
jgi:hypothetical protein